MKRAVFLVVPLLLAASACGDDDDDAGDGGEAASADWCELATDIDGLDEELNDVDFTDPDALEQAFRRFDELLDDAIDSAPDEIRDAVEEQADAFNEFRQVLEDVDFNLLEIDSSDLEAIGSDVEESADRIEQFNADECGIAIDDDADDGEADDGTIEDDAVEVTTDGDDADDEGDDDFDLGEGTIREQMIDGFVQSGFTEDEAECLVESLDFDDPDLADDPTAMLEVFDDCGIDMARLAELGESLGG